MMLFVWCLVTLCCVFAQTESVFIYKERSGPHISQIHLDYDDLNPSNYYTFDDQITADDDFDFQFYIDYWGDTCQSVSLAAENPEHLYCWTKVCRYPNLPSENTSLTFSQCNSDGGACSGNGTFSLFIRTQNGAMLVTDVISSPCGNCQSLTTFTPLSGFCWDYGVRYECLSGTCSATTAVNKHNKLFSRYSVISVTDDEISMDTRDAVSSCNSISSYAGGPVYNSAFHVCGELKVTISGCAADGGASSGGNLSYYLKDLSEHAVATHLASCEDGHSGSRVTFVKNTSTCDWYNVRQVCNSLSGCNATTVIVNGSTSSSATQRFALLEWDLGSLARSWYGVGFDVQTSWRGVSFDAYGNVEKLSMHNWNIQGSIPSDLFLNLPYVTTVDVSLNMLTGPLPIMPANCSDCSFASNFFTGPLPNCSTFSAAVLSLSDNLLSGEIDQWCASMVDVNYGTNYLTGMLPSVEFLTNLVSLAVDANLLTGTIGTLPTDGMLTFLVESNIFHGSLPAIAETALEYAHFSGNQFSGTIPVFPTTIINFGASQNNLTGTLPDLSEYQGLTQLLLRNNKLSGTIPSLCSYSSLEYVELSGNNFSCYNGCYKEDTYFDYMASYSIANFLAVQANYDVCWSSAIAALCELESTLDLNNQFLSVSGVVTTLSDYQLDLINDRTPTAEYLADTYPVLVTLTGDGITVQGPTFQDKGSNFGRFEVQFDPVSSALIEDNTIIVVFAIEESGSGEVRYLNSVGTTAYRVNPFYNFLRVDLTLYDNQSTEIQLLYYVRRYVRNMLWDCDKGVAVSNPCSWYGIGCEGNVLVTSLTLSDQFLASSIPASISSLTDLQTFSVAGNLLTGSIPSTMATMTNLQAIDVSSNRLTSLPSNMQSFTSVESLNLATNKFEGSVPTSLAALTQLEELDLRANAFSGQLSSSFCFMKTTTAKFQENYIGCYQDCPSGIPSGFHFDVSVSDCSPTHAPTPQPPPLNSGGIAGVTIGGVVFLALALFAAKYAVYDAPYRSLPLHKRLIQRRPIEESLVNAHQDTLLLINPKGQTLLDMYFANSGRYRGLISAGALVDIIEHALVADSSSKGDDSFSTTTACASWALLIQQEDESSFEAARTVLANHDENLNHLVFSCDSRGRRCLDIASPRIRDEMNKCCYLFRRFELDAGSYAYKSSTSLVVFAIDHGAHNETKTANTQSSGGVRVALKFVKHRFQFQAEIDVRAKAKFDTEFVVSVMMAFDGTPTHWNDENAKFRAAAIKRGFQAYPYCLVMPFAEMNMASYLTNHHVVGEDLNITKQLLRTLCNCLVHIHGRQIVHGDLKPQNLVLIANSIRLIDFDASTSCATLENGSFECAGLKYSTAYLPPEMLHDNGRCVKSFQMNVFGYRMDVQYLKEVESENVIALHSSGYQLVPSHPSQDMWAVGVLLYQLCCGLQLFPSSLDGNISVTDAHTLWSWNNQDKHTKLMYVEDKHARNLISLLLSKDPSQRPSAEQVLAHPFLTGVHPPRLQGEEAAFDVFLSYRVSSDLNHASSIYEALTGRGLKVWWDRKCLEPGQPWEEGFCNGLVNSSCFVCLVSRNAINNPNNKACNFGLLEASSKCDNVLLEWRLALELRARQMIEGVFPVFIGDIKENDDQVPSNDSQIQSVASLKYTNYNSSGCHPNSLPDVVVSSVEDKLKHHLEMQGLGFPYLHDQSVAKIVSDVRSYQGGFLKGEFVDAVTAICDSIVQMRALVRKHSETRFMSNKSDTELGKILR